MRGACPQVSTRGRGWSQPGFVTSNNKLITYYVKFEENCSNDITGTSGALVVVFFNSIVAIDDVLEGKFGSFFPLKLDKDWVYMTSFELNKQIVTEFFC